MTQEQEHTALPYRFYKMDNGYGFQIVNDKGNRALGNIASNGAGINGCSAQAKATAEFIVRACNSHYELLDIAKRAVTIINGIKADCIIKGEKNLLEIYERELAFIQAALAKAEGK